MNKKSSQKNFFFLFFFEIPKKVLKNKKMAKKRLFQLLVLVYNYFIMVSFFVSFFLYKSVLKGRKKALMRDVHAPRRIILMKKITPFILSFFFFSF
jgi:hypothetical protein